MRRATFLSAARLDLLDILTYITREAGSATVGRTYARKLRDKCHRLAAIEAEIGRARPELREDIRSTPYGNYVIFFRYVHGRFEVVNIIEGHRDIESLFTPDHRPRE